MKQFYYFVDFPCSNLQTILSSELQGLIAEENGIERCWCIFRFSIYFMKNYAHDGILPPLHAGVAKWSQTLHGTKPGMQAFSAARSRQTYNKQTNSLSRECFEKQC